MSKFYLTKVAISIIFLGILSTIGCENNNYSSSANNKNTQDTQNTSNLAKPSKPSPTSSQLLKIEKLSTIEYLEMCEASAAAAINDKHFVVGSDENNILHVYETTEVKPIRNDINLDKEGYFNNNPKAKGVDLEGATVLDGKIVWISSHGPNDNGEEKPNRQQLFATDFKIADGKAIFNKVNTSYNGLLADLLKDKRYEKYKFKEGQSIGVKKANSCNIEGLTTTPDKKLLIGFRNPIINGKALIVPLENPGEVLQGKETKLGDPIDIDLAGLGVRSIEYWPSKQLYLIVAGPFDDKKDFKLYQWSGKPNESAMEIKGISFGDLQPEAIIIFPSSNKFLVLSDDGKRPLDSTLCEELPIDKQKFRGVWFEAK